MFKSTKAFAKKGGKKGLSEIVGVIIALIMALGIASLIYSYVATAYSKSTRPIELIDEYCIDGNITFVVRNGGTANLNANSLSCYPISQSCSSSCLLPANIPSGGAAAIIATGCLSGRTHTWRLGGPSNSLQLYTFCPSSS